MIDMLKAEAHNETDKQDNYIFIPTLVTYLNMVFGSISIYISNIRDINMLKVASILILLAAVTDKLDGFAARKLNMSSDFGKELDSLCDIISFGLAPVVIAWNILDGSLNILEIIISLIYIGAGIFRLARFNITKDEKHFVGLPITIAGSIMALKYLIDIRFNISIMNNFALMIILSILMVGKFKVKKPRI